jgi:hypothetical protein
MNPYARVFWTLIALSFAAGVVIRIATGDAARATVAAWSVLGAAVVVLLVAERARRRGQR